MASRPLISERDRLDIQDVFRFIGYFQLILHVRRLDNLFRSNVYDRADLKVAKLHKKILTLKP